MKLSHIIAILLGSTAIAYANMSFEPSSACQSCHAQIYKEFTDSMHFNATPSKDPIHKAVWERHPKHKKMQRYGCGKCHTPTADNLELMTAKGKATKGVDALVDAKNPTHQEAISCAYCHRIESVKHGKLSNQNVISPKPKHYFGTLKEVAQSSFHTTSSENKNFQNGNICMGCHSHKANKAGLNVCSTNAKNELDGANCVSCHMPQVKGSISSGRETKTHAFHGFPGAHFNQEMLAHYIDIELMKNINDFEISVNNKSPHAMLLHPLRLAKMLVVIERQGKKINLKPHIFVRVIGKGGKATPPWIADAIIKDTMVQGNEKQRIRYTTKLLKGDKLTVHLGHYLVKPQALKQLGLQDSDVATKFYTLKKKQFVIK